MNKETFIIELRKGLSGMPQNSIDECISFYSEMIDDRIENGMNEEEAVSSVGSIEDIVSQTVSETPLPKLVKERIKPKRTLKAWEIVLIILGFPLWFPLLVAFGVIVLALYITIWALIISLWSIDVSVLAFGLASIPAAIVLLVNGNTLPGIAGIGIGFICIGLSFFLFFGCLAASKGILKLTKKLTFAIKSLFLRKEQ